MMKILNISFLILLLFQISCVDSKKKDHNRHIDNLVKKENDFKVVEQNLLSYKFKYETTQNKVYIDSISDLLKNSNYLELNDINSDNLELIFFMLFRQEKYLELKTMLSDSKLIEKETKDYLLNYVSAYYYYSINESSKGDLSIHKNINYINSKLEKKPNDENLLFEKYTMMLYINNLNNVVSEVDSLLHSNGNNFDHVFIEKSLLPKLEQYYEDLPIFVKKVDGAVQNDTASPRRARL